MAGCGVHASLIESEKALEAVEIDALCRNALLVQETREDIQHHVLTRYDQLTFILLSRMQQLAPYVHTFDRLHALFMP